VCDGIPFHYFVPPSAIITVRGDGIDREWSVTPEYRMNYPNGRDCGPGCRQAVVLVDVDT
jgi:hypothetical protein